MTDTIRVLRLYEFIGPRSLIAAQVGGSIHGQKVIGPISIRATTLGEFQESVAIPAPEFKLALVAANGSPICQK